MIVKTLKDEKRRLRATNASLAEEDAKDASDGYDDVTYGKKLEADHPSLTSPPPHRHTPLPMHPPPNPEVMDKKAKWVRDPTKYYTDEYLAKRGLDTDAAGEEWEGDPQDLQGEEVGLRGGDNAELTANLPRDRRGIGLGGKDRRVEEQSSFYDNPEAAVEAERLKLPKPAKEKLTKAQRTDLNFRRQKIKNIPWDGATHAWCKSCSDEVWEKKRIPWSYHWKLPEPRNWICPKCTGDVEFYQDRDEDIQWEQGGIWRHGKNSEWFTPQSWKTADFGQGVPEQFAPKRRQPDSGRGSGSRKAEAPGRGGWPSENSWVAAPSSSSSSSKWRRF